MDRLPITIAWTIGNRDRTFADGMPGPAARDPAFDIGARLAITFVDAPAKGDDVTEQEGRNVNVAPELVQASPDATVDVKPIDGETQLVLERAWLRRTDVASSGGAC